MKLFIIGNGFDIGHGLPTGYWDFRTFLDLVYPEFLRSFEEHYDIYPGMSAEAKKKTLWSRFESNLANIDEDTIIEIGTSIELDLESGDVGIEDTLYSYFTDEYQYIEKLAGYLKQWVRSIKIRDCLPRTSFGKTVARAVICTIFSSWIQAERLKNDLPRQGEGLYFL